MKRDRIISFAVTLVFGLLFWHMFVVALYVVSQFMGVGNERNAVPVAQKYKLVEVWK